MALEHRLTGASAAEEDALSFLLTIYDNPALTVIGYLRA